MGQVPPRVAVNSIRSGDSVPLVEATMRKLIRFRTLPVPGSQANASTMPSP